jgi:arginyl-tRNA synthetase
MNSIVARCKQKYLDSSFPMPEESYVGEEVIDVANKVYEKYGNNFDDYISNVEIKMFVVNKIIEKIKHSLSTYRVFFDT